MPSQTTTCHDGEATAGPIRWTGRATGRPRRVQECPGSLNLEDPAEIEQVARLLIRVRDLPLPSRARVCAEKLGLLRVGDLIQVSPNTFLHQRNFGRRSLQVLHGTLERLGLGLGLRVDGWPPANLPILLRQRRKSIRDALRRMFIPRSEGKLEDELQQLAAPAGSPRNVFIAARRLGWDGGGGVTLDETGREHRISKQRASQIVKRVRQQYKHARISPPHVVRCLRAATPRLAEDAGAVEDRLLRSGKTHARFRLEGLLTAAETLHVPAPFEIIHIGARRVVVRAGKGVLLLSIVERAVRAAGRSGAVGIDDFAYMLRSKCSVADLGELLPLHPQFEWLDDAKTWFWFRPVFSQRPGRVRNRLVNKISKVVSVVSPIRLGELRSLMQRRRPIGATLPPNEILLQVYRRIPWLTVREDAVIRNECCDTKHVEVGRPWMELVLI